MFSDDVERRTDLRPRFYIKQTMKPKIIFKKSTYYLQIQGLQRPQDVIHIIVILIRPFSDSLYPEWKHLRLMCFSTL